MLLGSEFIGGLPLTKLNDYESYLKAGCKKLWAHWKAADIVAEQVRNVPMEVRRGEKVVTPPSDLAALLAVANPEMTFDELVYLIVMHLKFTGNGFMAKMRDGTSKTKALYPMNPKRVEIVPNDDGTVRGYLLSVGSGGRKVPFDVDEVIHFRRFHPNNDFWGIGESEAGEAMLQDGLNRGDWSSNFWTNGAAPAGLLVEKSDNGPSPRDFERIKASFKKEYGGRDNSGKIGFLTGKWEWMQLGMDADVMQNIEQQRWSVEQTFMLHGVPLSIAGVKDAANFATAQIDEYRLRKYGVKPMIKCLEATLNSDLLAEWGLKIAFAISTLENIGAVMDGLDRAFDRGIVSINECRTILGLKPDLENDLWKQHFINSNLVPLEMAGEMQADLASAVRSQVIAERNGGQNGNGNGNGKLLHDALVLPARR